MKKDLICLQDLSGDEILKILDYTEKLKTNPQMDAELLKGKSLALVFQKPSNRTRVSFEVGIYQLGGNCVYLGPNEISLGVRETTHDVAKTLSRYLDGIICRTFSNEDVVDLAKHASIPIINGLCNFYHPCQGLTDLFSIKEKLDSLEGKTVTYIGDGNNVCASLLIGCSKIGLNMNVATPSTYKVHESIIEKASQNAETTGAKIQYFTDPKEAVKNVDVIYSDVWVSMGQEEETKQRLKDFDGYQINEELVRLANPNYLFMHCLPAHRGQEVTAEIIDGKNSIVFDQAENRLHTQKAILKFLFE